MDAQAQENFVRLFAKAEHEIFRYVVALVPQLNDAQDIVQETAVALWRKFDQYDPAEPFVPWACRFAWYEVHKHRRRAPHAQVVLSEEAWELLALEFEPHRPVLDRRLAAIAQCLDKLPARTRQLLAQRYTGDISIQELARQTNRSVHTLYKTLDRTRRLLVQCVDRVLQAEER